jgi:cystathionine beta-lyase
VNGGDTGSPAARADRPEHVPGFDDLDRAALRARPGAKWHRHGAPVLPSWVADMDFPLAPVVTDALHRFIDRGDFGYPDWPDASPVRQEFAGRMAARYGWHVSASRVREQTDLIQSMQLILRLATAPGDAVAVPTPSYPHFLSALRSMKRRTVAVPMADTSCGWRLDMAGLADGVVRHGCKVLVLVNPHNPTGRVLSREELQEIAAIARRHDLLVVSDEIHAELVYSPHRHVPFASLSPDAAARTVTLTSAIKAFNFAALRCAVTHYGPDRLLALRDAEPSDLYGTVSTLAVVATLAAWREGDAWQRDLLAVLDRNRRRVADFLACHLPRLRHHMPEGTYLAWLDARECHLDEPPVERILRAGEVLVDGGTRYGPEAGEYVRLNFATSRDILEDILGGLARALG